MQNAIDVRDMSTAIHSLFLVRHKPKTVLNAFRGIELGDCPYDNYLHWQVIEDNTENLGEIDYRALKGDRVWIGGKLVSDVLYDDGEYKYKVIGSSDLWGI